MKRQPLITTGVITALVAAILGVLTAFGVPLTDMQQDAINQLMAVLAPLIVAGVGWRFVTPQKDPRTDDGRPGKIVPR